MTLPCPIEAVVFDLDGTLVDSFEDLVRTSNHVRGLYGLPPLSLPEVEVHVGRGVRHLVRSILDLREGEEGPAVAEYRAYYRAHLVDASRPYPGVLKALDALKGIPMAVLSNKPDFETRHVVEALGLDRHFRVVRGGDPFPTLKPDPAALLTILDTLGATPGRSLMVGDSDVDLKTARAAGAFAVLVRTGQFARATVTPDLVVDSIEDLAKRMRTDRF